MGSFHLILVTTVLTIIVLQVHLSLTLDNTIVEKSVGKDVVEAVVEKIRRSNIFPDDYEFLRRLAYVETRDGESNTTFPADFFGGIWNVYKSYFDWTKHDSLSSFHDQISTSFNIKWSDVVWNDLLKPLHSGLAARLYLQRRKPDIPQTMKEQGVYWEYEYNSKDSLHEDYFVNGTEELINSTETCSGKMDMVIALDGSSSVNLNNPNNFDTGLKFVVDLIASYSMEHVRSGLVIFSSIPYPIFDLNHKLTMEELRNLTLSVRYPDEQTNTNEALLAAHTMFASSTPRHGIPQVFTIFTDGRSKPEGVDNIDLLKNLGISSYVVGITDEVNREELIKLAYGNPYNVFTLNNFEVLAEFFKRLNTETCKIPQKPEMDTPMEESLNQNEKRFYTFTIPTEGMTISVKNVEGQTKGFYSFDEVNPSSAVNDGVLAYEGTFIQAKNFKADQTVYVSVQGLDTVNNVVLKGITGYAVGPTTTSTTTTAATTTEGAGTHLESVFFLVLASILSSMRYLHIFY